MLLKALIIVTAFLFVLSGQILTGLLLIGFTGVFFALAETNDRLGQVVEALERSRSIDVSETPTKVDINA